VLEFAFGVLAGWCWLRGFRLGAGPAAVLAAAALALLVTNPWGLVVAPGTTTTPNDLLRVISWGAPALALLVAAVGFEQGRTVNAPGIGALRRLGDSSYALYLTHPFALIGVDKGSRWLALHHHLPWPLLAALMAATAVVVGLLVHHFVETPITRWLKRPRRRRPPSLERSGSAQ
jgi:peptidoglycan/LPS O-acetylase OafA/YrhL